MIDLILNINKWNDLDWTGFWILSGFLMIVSNSIIVFLMIIVLKKKIKLNEDKWKKLVEPILYKE